MSRLSIDQLSQVETACGSLLYELKVIWDEVGESEADQDKMLLELEQECLQVYKRKVDQANRSRAQIRQAIADSEAVLAAICSAMGERPVHLRQPNQPAGSLKEELKCITPHLEEMQKRKCDRMNQFLEVIDQIKKIASEIKPNEDIASKFTIDESDLSIRRLEDFYRHLESLKKEKSERLKQVIDYLNTLNSLCSVLGMDFKETIREIHPSLNETEGPRNISDVTITMLASATEKFLMIKIERMQKLQDLATTMLELWNLMDTPIEEQQLFQNITCKIAASEKEIIEPNILSEDFINYVKTEVSRLEQLKISKMKEIVLKKKAELEEIRKRIHLVAEAKDEIESAIDAIEAGTIDACLVLEQIEAQISTVKEEAFNRKDVLERVEKWMVACEEESWLEEYNRDENRFAGRGAHLALKRAEKARTLVNKIPAQVETLAAKVAQWENERGSEFKYDGLHLLSMLENYMVLRQEKEEERKRQRDQKKLQGQLIAEQEALYGSKPSPAKPPSAKKMPRISIGGPNRRLSLGGAVVQPPKPDFQHSTKATRSNKNIDDLSTLSPGSGGLDISGLPAKKLSYNAVTSAREVDTPRKPFAQLVPVSNIPSTPSKTFSNIPSTPSKTLYTLTEDEMKNPKVTPAPPTPNTPKTLLAPMDMATTPAPTSLVYETRIKVVPPEETEYSYEERRLALYLRRNDLPACDSKF